MRFIGREEERKLLDTILHSQKQAPCMTYLPYPAI